MDNRLALHRRSKSASEKEDALGIKILSEGKNPCLDIIAIHGLNGHWTKSWTHENRSMWLRDFLSADLPSARIITYGYDARSFGAKGDKPLAHATIRQHSDELVRKICLFREQGPDTSRRPLIFVAHSLGGIIVKQALFTSHNYNRHHRENERALKISTYGIVYLGTPHDGAPIATWAKFLQNLAIAHQTSDRILKHLEEHSEWLRDLTRNYTTIGHEFDTVYCYEGLPTKLPRTQTERMIVPEWSAAPTVANVPSVLMNKDHISMTKFGSEADDDYKTISLYLGGMAKKAGAKVQENWAACDGPETLHMSIVDRHNALFSKVGFSLGRDAELLPPGHPTGFVGRDQTLTKMKEFFHSLSNNTRTIVLHGSSGMGKTEIALQYAWTDCTGKRSAFHSSILWLNASSAESLQTSFVKIANALLAHYRSGCSDPAVSVCETAAHLGLEAVVDDDGKIATQKLDSKTIPKAVNDWLGRKGNDKWLAIFDGYGGCDGEDSFELQGFLPKSQTGSLIITTTNREVCGLGRALHIGCFTPSEGQQLLLQSSQRRHDLDRSQDEDNESIIDDTKLLERLGYLPLAIEHAGAFMHMESKDSKSYLKQLETNPKRNLSKRSPYHRHLSTFETWTLSFETVRRRHPQAAHTLLVCSLFHHEDIPIRLIQRPSTSSHDQSQETIQAAEDEVDFLVSYSLIKRSAAVDGITDGVTVHCLSHLCGRESVGTEELRSLVCEALRTTARLICRQDGFLDASDNWEFERRILSHVRSIATLGEQQPGSEQDDGPSISEGDAWLQLALYFQAHGLYSQSETLFEMALRAGPPGRPRAKALLYQARLYRRQSKMDAAERIYDKILLEEKLLEKSEWSAIHAGLANIAEHRRDYAQAETHYKSALSMLQESGQRRPDGPQALVLKDDVARIYKQQKKFEDAEKIWLEEILVHGKQLGPDHPTILRGKANLAASYDARKEYEKAETLYEELLIQRLKVQGETHPSTLRTQHGLAIAYFHLGKLPDARRLFEEVLRKRDEVLGPYHIDTIYTLQQLVRVNAKASEEDPAFLRQTVDCCEKLLERLRSDQHEDSRRRTMAEKIEKFKEHYLLELRQFEAPDSEASGEEEASEPGKRGWTMARSLWKFLSFGAGD